MLFADGELTDMRSRWTEVQSAFVDDPRDCVQKADGLVADVVDKLTTGFSGARAHLEEQWSSWRGGLDGGPANRAQAVPGILRTPARGLALGGWGA